jgi:ribosomal protein S18 acetylase RimI-like enzyme
MIEQVIVSEIVIPDRKKTKSIARLHMRAFPKFFLTQLGYSFLETLYVGYIEDKDSGIIIAEKEGDIVGFIAYSNDYPKFYQGLMKRHMVKFIICSMAAAIKHPSFIKRLLGALRKSDEVKREEKYVELASICVDPQIESNGIGTLLIDYLKSIVDYAKYEYINLETDAVGNDAVNKFYMKNGFILERQYITPEGRVMNEYRFKGK